MSKSLFRSTTLVSGMTAISRVLGFVRDMLIAQLFGATGAIDAFYVAFRIPNFMRALFAEGAFAQAFVPVLSEYRQNTSPEQAKQFISHMQANLAVALILITALAILFSPALTTLFAPGFLQDPQRFELTTHMLRITFPYLFLISMTAFYASILNAYGKFGAASFTPVLLNLAMIFAAVWLSPQFAEPVVALAWGVFIAGVVQCLFLMPFLKYAQLLVLPRLAWRDPGVRKVLKLLVPALFGVSVAQIGLLIDTLFASFLPAGSITWLYYSDRLIYFPLGIFGVALATVILPHLSRQHAKGSAEDFSSALDWALRCILLIAVPSAIGLYTMAGPLFAALFQYGEFNAYDVEMATLSLKAFAFGLPAFMLVKILASGFYSKQNIKTPVKIAVAALTINMLLNFALIGYLKHEGLALATSIASTLNAALLAWFLIKRGYYQIQKGWGVYLVQLAVSGAAVAALVTWFSPDIYVWIGWSWQYRLLNLSLLLTGAVMAYFVCLYATGVRLKHFRK